jgi:hypothetical protein
MTITGIKSVQIQWFTMGDIGLVADKIFEVVLGEEPESIQKNKIPSPQKPFLSQASNSTEEYTHLVQVLPGRIILSAMPNELPGGNDKPPLLPLVYGMQFLRNVIERIRSDDFIPANRIAVNCEILDVFETLEEANSCAFKYSQVNAPVGTHDFRMQINARRKLNEDIDVNRIFSYSVQNYELFDMQFAGGMPSFMTAPSRRIWYTCILAIDLNTVPINQPINKQKEIFENFQKQLEYLSSQKKLECLYE